MEYAAERRCPDCGLVCPTFSALTDHALTAHVAAETPAASIRRPRIHGMGAGVLSGLGIVAGAVLWGALIYGIAGGFGKDEVAPTPTSVVHRIAVALERAGEIDSYRAVEPKEGWDTEYELDEEADGPNFGLPDAFIRIRSEGTASQDVEFQAYSQDLYDSIERELTRHGFAVESG